MVFFQLRVFLLNIINKCNFPFKTRTLLRDQQDIIVKLQEITLRSLALGEKSLFSTSVLDVVTQKITPDDRDESYVKNFETNKTEIAFKVCQMKIKHRFIPKTCQF